MTSFSALLAIGIAAAAVAVNADSVVVYGQCGGLDYSGSKTCVAGTTCVYSNPYYSQCLPSTCSASQSPTTPTPGGQQSSNGGSSTPSTKTPTKTSTAPTTSNPSNAACSGNRTKFKYFGVNQSGYEWGPNAIPGTSGSDYFLPETSSIDYFLEKKFNIFRVPFLMERMSPPATGLGGDFDATYLSGYTKTINYITGKGGYAIVDPHNYMRYNGAIITSTSDFQAWWNKLAAQFKSNPKVIFGIQNEPNGIAAQDVFNLEQAALNGIRASGATTQLILVQGTQWTGAWTWATDSGNSDYFGSMKDPNNNFAIEMHQYLDSDASGSSGTCVDPQTSADRMTAATNWLKSKGLKGFLGEIGAGANDNCIQGVQKVLCAMQESGVWIGLTWWAAGPDWGSYFTSIEPPNGAAIAEILPQALEPFL